MTNTKRDQSDLVAFRLPDDLRSRIETENLSSFIKDAIKDKLNREEKLKTCPKCKGRGKIKR